MFMTFKSCDMNGNPQGNRICLNCKEISHVVEIGQWLPVQVPIEDVTTDWAGVPARPPRRATARPRTPDNFVVTPGVVSITTYNQTYTVVADFQELSKMLESLTGMAEYV